MDPVFLFILISSYTLILFVYFILYLIMHYSYLFILFYIQLRSDLIYFLISNFCIGLIYFISRYTLILFIYFISAPIYLSLVMHGSYLFIYFNL